MENSCEVCLYRVMVAIGGDTDAPLEEFYCHRYPPTVDPQQPNSLALWPVVDRGDWCGEFVPESEP